MIFVDTGAWFAFVVPTDPNHQSAKTWLAQNTRILLTSDYVVDEVLTLLRARGGNRRAIELGESFFDGTVALVHHLDDNLLHEAWRIFRSFDDKGWSFTDCTSKALIEQLGVDAAISFDRHFEQFGSVQILP